MHPRDHTLDPTDDRRHAALLPGAGAGRERLDCFFADEQLAVAGHLGLTFDPARRRTDVWIGLLRTDEPLVTILEPDAPLPPGDGVEIRTSGLWLDVITEVPLDHLTVGLEAFAIALDDPAEAFGRGWGDRVPLGFDLEWETSGDGWDEPGRLELPCRVHGEVLVGHDALALDGIGHRSRRWGAAVDAPLALVGSRPVGATVVATTAVGLPATVDLVGPVGESTFIGRAWSPHPDRRCRIRGHLAGSEPRWLELAQ